MRLALVTAPSVEPVSLSDVKAHCRVTISDDDSYLTTLITVARRRVEQLSHARLITQIWDMFLDVWDNLPQQSLAFFGIGGQTGLTIYADATSKNLITLPHYPVQSVTYINYTDTANNQQTWDTANYVVCGGAPCRIAPKQYTYFPVVATQPEAINIRYVAGYSSDSSLVPAEAIHAIKLLVEHYYNHRGAVDDQTMDVIPMGVSDLISSFSIGSNLFA